MVYKVCLQCSGVSRESSDRYKLPTDSVCLGKDCKRKCLPSDSHQWPQGIETSRRQLVIPEGSDRTWTAGV